MSTELMRVNGGAVAPNAPSNITDVQRLGGLLSASGYFSDAREMAQAAVKVLAGQELGIPPVAAMMGINIIKGKVALSGNLIASRVRAHGYDFKHMQFDNKGCVLRFYGRPDAMGKRDVLGDSSFTEDDAKAAQCFGDMYKKFPRNMYFNRAMSNGAKWFTPEVLCGLPVYVPEELGATVDAEGEMVHPEPTQATVLETKLTEAKAAGVDVAKYSKPAEVIPPEVTKMWKRMDEGKYPTLEVFGDLKDQCQIVLGDEQGKAAYYAALKAHGVEKSDQFRSSKPAKACARAIWEALAAARHSAEGDAIRRAMGDMDDPKEAWVPTLEEMTNG